MVRGHLHIQQRTGSLLSAVSCADTLWSPPRCCTEGPHQNWGRSERCGPSLCSGFSLVRFFNPLERLLQVDLWLEDRPDSSQCCVTSVGMVSGTNTRVGRNWEGQRSWRSNPHARTNPDGARSDRVMELPGDVTRDPAQRGYSTHWLVGSQRSRGVGSEWSRHSRPAASNPCVAPRSHLTHHPTRFGPWRLRWDDIY